MSEQAHIDLLREEGYTDAEIEAELGINLTPKPGWPPPSRHDLWTNAVGEAWLAAEAVKLGRTPSQAVWQRSLETPGAAWVRGRYASWGAFCEAAGLEWYKPKKANAARDARAAAGAGDPPTRGRPSSLTGPAKQPAPSFVAPDGSPVLTLSELGGGAKEKLMGTLTQFLGEDAELDGLIGAGANGKNALPAARLAGLPRLSRGGKVKRLAEAFARLQGTQWPLLTSQQRVKYVTLADRAMSALELVEYEEMLLVKPGSDRMLLTLERELTREDS